VPLRVTSRSMLSITKALRGSSTRASSGSVVRGLASWMTLPSPSTILAIR
jgi:hypothetical protein